MKTAHTLAQEYGCVYVEDLKTRNMTKSAKGTLDNPGKKSQTEVRIESGDSEDGLFWYAASD